MTSARHARGFTILELMTVVAVMIILAAILWPVLAECQETARRSACLSHLHQIALAHQVYVQDHDDTLPGWEISVPGGSLVWTEFLRPYFRDPQILNEGLTSAEERRRFTWLADYALCAWGPGGNGTLDKPYWRWPGSPAGRPGSAQPMRLAEVRRPAATVQITDGLTIRRGPYFTDSYIRRRHRNGVLNGAFVDGHAQRISDVEWNRIDRDDRGYFYVAAAADR